jgi:small-conductance mechanosensitive channel/CRP-like cAMP-binding protein
MKKIILPSILCFATLLFYGTLKFTDSTLLDETGLTYLLAFFFACLSVVGVRCTSFVLFDIFYIGRTKREAPELLRMLFSLVTYALLLAMIVSQVLKKDLSGLLATSAVLSVVIGLALQDTLVNFFAGTSIHIEQPFQIMDSIRIRDKAGRVEAVSWRTTTLRTSDNSMIIFPNSQIAREPIEVYHYNQLQRHRIEFTAPYSIFPETAVKVAVNAARALPGVFYENEPRARIVGFGDSSINYELLYWVKDFMLVKEINAQLRKRIWYSFNRDGIDMPFPVRHVLLERQKSATPERVQAVDYREKIECIDIFQPLSPAERDTVIGANSSAIYAPGETMVVYGDPGESMFIIGRGKAEVQIRWNGEPKTVAVLEAGSYFGEMSLFSGEPRSADVIAMEEVEVLEIKKPCIQKLLIENDKLVDAFSQIVTERQASLAGFATSGEEVTAAQTGTIMARIRKFFNLA